MADQLFSPAIATFQAPASMDHWEEFNDFVANQANRFLGSGKQSYNLRLACEELVSNIIRHSGGRNHPRPVTLHLSAHICERTGGERSLVIQISDDGPFFDPQLHLDRDINKHLPAAERPIGGLGLFLVQQSVDRVEYNWINDMNNYHLYMDLSRPSSV